MTAHTKAEQLQAMIASLTAIIASLQGHVEALEARVKALEESKADKPAPFSEQPH